MHILNETTDHSWASYVLCFGIRSYGSVITPNLGKWSRWNRAGQSRPRHDQRPGCGRKSSTKTPALGLQDRESFRPSKTRNRLGSSAPHCLGPIFQPQDMSWEKGNWSAGPKGSVSQQRLKPQTSILLPSHVCCGSAVLLLYTVFASGPTQCPHKEKKETKKTTTGP